MIGNGLKWMENAEILQNIFRFINFDQHWISQAIFFFFFFLYIFHEVLVIFFNNRKNVFFLVAQGFTTPPPLSGPTTKKKQKNINNNKRFKKKTFVTAIEWTHAYMLENLHSYICAYMWNTHVNALISAYVLCLYRKSISPEAINCLFYICCQSSSPLFIPW